MFQGPKKTIPKRKIEHMVYEKILGGYKRQKRNAAENAIL